VTSTWVSPNFTKQEPSAYLTTPRSSEMAAQFIGCRRLGRMGIVLWVSRQMGAFYEEDTKRTSSRLGR
jgi:hypothetical protein